MLSETVDALARSLRENVPLTEQQRHRLNIVKAWLDVAKKASFDLDDKILGRKSLDIGCGQGDMIEVFAAILEYTRPVKSFVLGIDPGSLTYGTPITLGDAQSALLEGPFGSCLGFRQTTAPTFLASQPETTYQTAYFAHSLYYFPSAAAVYETFAALRNAGIGALLLAEWDLSISHAAALPHLLATLLQSASPLPEGNVRTVLGSGAYIKLAQEAGWELVGVRIVQPGPGLEDGRWETGIALDIAREAAETGILGNKVNGPETSNIEILRAHEAALQKSIENLTEGGVIRCMDVFAAVLRPAKR